jgi:hypothetical protein
MPFSTTTTRRRQSLTSILVCVLLPLVVLPAASLVLAFSPPSILPLSVTTTTTTTARRRRLHHGAPPPFPPPPAHPPPKQQPHCITASKNKNDDDLEEENTEVIMTSRSCVFSRRVVFTAFAASAVTMSGNVVLVVQPACATYSAYTRREQDWQERQKSSNGVTYKTASDLRRELRQIAPMNSEASRIFCPNGPSSAVSPLMENKCSDVVFATPSVYGRSNDVLGNSVPGFTDGRSSERYASSLSDTAGFPSYFKSTK